MPSEDSEVQVRRRWAIAATGILLVTTAACSSPSTPAAGPTTTSATTAAAGPTTTSATTPATVAEGSSAELAQCQSDAKVLETALAAYQALTGAYPAPPSPWSTATYVANFEALTAHAGAGPFMAMPPSTAHYVIEFDSAGQVWVAPPGSYGASFNPAQSFDSNPDVCLAAVR